MLNQFKFEGHYAILNLMTDKVATSTDKERILLFTTQEEAKMVMSYLFDEGSAEVIKFV